MLCYKYCSICIVVCNIVITYFICEIVLVIMCNIVIFDIGICYGVVTYIYYMWLLCMSCYLWYC